MMVSKQMLQKALSQSVRLCSDDSPFSRHLVRPRTRPADLPGSGKIGAVLLLLHQDSPESWPKIVLTKRHTHLNHHAGEISLPGGRQDPGESLQETAIREAVEEIGAVPSQIDMIGTLSSVYIPPSDFTIHPFVAWYNGNAEFVRSESEVMEIIDVSLEQLCHPETLRFGRIHNESREISAHYFGINLNQIWGATAMVVYEFIQRIKAAGDQDVSIVSPESD